MTSDEQLIELLNQQCQKLRSENNAISAKLAETEKFLEPTGWQKAQDDYNRVRARLEQAEQVLRSISRTDYRGNRSTEAAAAQRYFDAAAEPALTTDSDRAIF